MVCLKVPHSIVSYDIRCSRDPKVTMKINIIAFHGTGIMGAPMTRKLTSAGFALPVWNFKTRPSDWARVMTFSLNNKEP